MSKIKSIKLPNQSVYDIYDKRLPEVSTSDSGKTFVVQDDGTIELGEGGKVNDVYVDGVSVLDSYKIAQIDLTGKQENIAVQSTAPTDPNTNIWIDTSGQAIFTMASSGNSTVPIQHETWTFTLENGTTVEKEVVIWT